MAMLLLNSTTTNDMVSQVGYWQGQGFVPACGLTYHNGKYFQPMVTGDAGGIPYGIIDKSTDADFQSAANFAESTYGAFALGDMQIIKSRFIQAFGAPAGVAEPVNEGAVLSVINAATTTGTDYAGLTSYIYTILYATGRDINDPDFAGLREFIQGVIDAQP